MNEHIETKQRDPQAHGAAKADINKTLHTKVRELKAEARELDTKIQELEISAVREADGDRVVELLAEKSRLAARREALPILLRGFQVRALQAQAGALFEEAADIKPELDAAEAELEAAIKLVPELESQLEEARRAVTEKTARRDQLSNSYNSLNSAAGSARADAGCIERGEKMQFQPNRFDGIVTEID